MSAVFKKMNLKDQDEVVVLNAPESFDSELAALPEEVAVRRDLAAVERVDFALAFVTKQEEVDRLARAVAAKAQGDALVWFAYPKASSKRYTCEFNRDTGWDELGRLGFEPVRQVAVDEDWSALRFRRVEFIKSMKRDKSRALSQEGRKRVS